MAPANKPILRIYRSQPAIREGLNHCRPAATGRAESRNGAASRVGPGLVMAAFFPVGVLVG